VARLHPSRRRGSWRCFRCAVWPACGENINIDATPVEGMTRKSVAGARGPGTPGFPKLLPMLLPSVWKSHADSYNARGWRIAPSEPGWLLARGRLVSDPRRALPARGRAVRFVQFSTTLLVTALAGCSRSHSSDEVAPSADDVASIHLSEIGLLYGTYLGQSRGRPPKAVKQLEDFGQGRISPEHLAAIHAANVAELFISPRDGKPYKMVNYTRVPAPSADPVVVFYEQQGEDGTRRVALLGGGSIVLDEERLGKLVPGFKP
jgi:hypothetical protein